MVQIVCCCGMSRWFIYRDFWWVQVQSSHIYEFSGRFY